MDGNIPVSPGYERFVPKKEDTFNYIAPLEYLKTSLIILYISLFIFIAGLGVSLFYNSWKLAIFLGIFVAAMLLFALNQRNIIKERSQRPEEPFEKIVFQTKVKNDFSNLQKMYINENVNLMEQFTGMVLHSFEVFDESGENVGLVKESWLDIKDITNNLGYATIAKFLPPQFMGTKEILFLNSNNELFMKARQSFNMTTESVVEILTPDEKVVAKLIAGFSLPRQKVYILNSKNQVAGEIKKSFFGWETKIYGRENEVCGIIKKRFAGILKELFTTADKYELYILGGSLDTHITTALPVVFDRLLGAKVQTKSREINIR